MTRYKARLVVKGWQQI
jgi:hypothetical protein